MSQDNPDIVLIEKRLAPKELARLVHAHFEDMVKYVVDIERRLAAVGGELHADAEQLLLQAGCRQENLWGANYYPGRGLRSASSTRRSSISVPPKAIAYAGG